MLSVDHAVAQKRNAYFKDLPRADTSAQWLSKLEAEWRVEEGRALARLWSKLVEVWRKDDQRSAKVKVRRLLCVDFLLSIQREPSRLLLSILCLSPTICIPVVCARFMHSPVWSLAHSICVYS